MPVTRDVLCTKLMHMVLLPFTTCPSSVNKKEELYVNRDYSVLPVFSVAQVPGSGASEEL